MQSIQYNPSMTAGGITVSYELVTPEYARALLKGNTHNRKSNEKQIKKLAALHATEHWVQTGDPIRLTHDGIVVDGQHRLLAIVKSGVPQFYFIMRGVQLIAQEVIDTGSRRTLSAMLNTRKEKNVAELAAVIKAIYAWEVLGFRSAEGYESIPINVLLKYFDENAEHIRGVTAQSKRLAAKISGGIAGVALAIHALEKIDIEDSSHFWERLMSDFGHTEGDPISTLRNSLLKDRELAVGRQASCRGQTWRLAVIIKAWNAYRKGEQIFRLRYSPGGAHPEKMPEPI